MLQMHLLFSDKDVFTLVIGLFFSGLRSIGYFSFFWIDDLVTTIGVKLVMHY